MSSNISLNNNTQFKKYDKNVQHGGKLTDMSGFKPKLYLMITGVINLLLGIVAFVSIVVIVVLLILYKLNLTKLVADLSIQSDLPITSQTGGAQVSGMLINISLGLVGVIAFILIYMIITGAFNVKVGTELTKDDV